jgi:hypothetical protein
MDDNDEDEDGEYIFPELPFPYPPGGLPIIIEEPEDAKYGVHNPEEPPFAPPGVNPPPERLKGVVNPPPPASNRRLP